MKQITVDIPTPDAFENMLKEARRHFRMQGGDPHVRDEKVAYIDLLKQAIQAEDGHASPPRH